MTKQYLYDYLGRPKAYKFVLDDYCGPRGLLRPIALVHKNRVISGNKLYRQVCDHYGIELDRWEFLYELGLWCHKHVGEDEIQVGKSKIIKGRIKCGTSWYYIIPHQVLDQYEETVKVAN